MPHPRRVDGAGKPKKNFFSGPATKALTPLPLELSGHIFPRTFFVRASRKFPLKKTFFAATLMYTVQRAFTEKEKCLKEIMERKCAIDD